MRCLTSPPLLAPIIVIAGALLVSSCVRLKTATLYSGVEERAAPARPSKLSLVVEPVIYEDDSTHVWFMDNTSCVTGGTTTDQVFQGSRALEVSWNRSAAGCEWSGMGFGWDDWIGKDISEIVPFAAIEMHVRSKEGRMFGLPIVLTFEDYSGGQSYSYTGNKYFERSFIDEDWQRVVVPLNTFDVEGDGLDPTNVKQLILEFQQSGSIFLDSIRLTFYEEESQEPWLVEGPRPNPLDLPIQIFDDAFINDHGYGLTVDDCQSIQIAADDHSTGDRSLHVEWDLSGKDCPFSGFGVSWSAWYPIDVRPILTTAALQFDVRTTSGAREALPISVELHDYNHSYTNPDRALVAVALTSDYVQGGSYRSEWTTVAVPLSHFQGDADLSNVKELAFRLRNQGEVYVDNIRLVRTGA